LCLGFDEWRRYGAYGQRRQNGNPDFAREHLSLFSIAIVGYLMKPLRMARKVPSPTVKHFAVDLPFAWNIPREKVFSPNNTGVLPHQEFEWLSGTTIFCAKA